MIEEQGSTSEDNQVPSRSGRIRDNRGALLLTALVLVLFSIDFFWSSHIANTAAEGRAQIQQQAIAAEQKAIEAGCSFWEPLVSLPVTVVPGQTKPTKLSVRILAGARIGYAGQCRPPRWPQITPADPSLVKWARIYDISMP